MCVCQSSWLKVGGTGAGRAGAGLPLGCWISMWAWNLLLLGFTVSSLFLISPAPTLHVGLDAPLPVRPTSTLSTWAHWHSLSPRVPDNLGRLFSSNFPSFLEPYPDSAENINLSRLPQSLRSEEFLCYFQEALLFVHLDFQSIWNWFSTVLRVEINFF